MISREWVEQTLESPDQVEDREDGTQHFIKKIPEYGNRSLRVVINVRRSKPPSPLETTKILKSFMQAYGQGISRYRPAVVQIS